MILVTGSTGLVGRHLLLALTQEGKQVCALFRSEHKKKEVETFFAFAKAESHLNHINWAQGDITDIPSLTDIFKDITHVYHCAALISFDPYDFKKLTKVNVEGTANVVNLCLAYGVKKLVYLSSIATLASLPNTPITEENYWDPNAENSVYALTKNGAEMEVWRGTEEGLDAIIFNPGIILGEGDYTSGSGTLFNYILKEKSYYPTGSTAVIDVKDLSQVMIKGMNSNVVQERYITIAHNVSYQKLFETIANALHKKTPHKPLHNWLLKVLNTLDTLRGFFVKKRKLTRVGYVSLQSDSYYSNDKVQKVFNHAFKSLEETVSRVVKHIT